MTDRKNDWFATLLNIEDKPEITENVLYANGITPDNTGIKDRDYYKNVPQVQERFTKDGKFDESAYNQYYDSALRSYNQYSNTDFTNRLLDAFGTSKYDINILSNPGQYVQKTNAVIYDFHDRNRHSYGIGNLWEMGDPNFSDREVAQTKKVRDENGNELDWTPNDKGGLLKGLWRPALVMASWDEDGTHIENGREVQHKKGELKLDKYGDPYTELLGNRDAYGKDVVKYSDVLTIEGTKLNNWDPFDSDGLEKSIGSTVAKTFLGLAPFFIPTVGPWLGGIAALGGLASSLPVISKAVDSFITGSDNDNFGRSMTKIENFMLKFGGSQSDEARGRFFSLENIGEVVRTSAGQLFSQRVIGELPTKLAQLKQANKLTTKLGQNLSLGYMALTSAQDTYGAFKEAGASDWLAGIGMMATTAGFWGLMNTGYFKDKLFEGSLLDEDQRIRRNLTQISLETAKKQFGSDLTKVTFKPEGFMDKMATSDVHAAKFFANVVKKTRELAKKLPIGRAGGVENAFFSRSMNEGIEETMEEVMQDVIKGFGKGLEALGFNVSEDNATLDFGMSPGEMLQRYGTSFVGGAIGGATFELFNQIDLITRPEIRKLYKLPAFQRMAYDLQNPDNLERYTNTIEKMYKRGNTGNKNLSALNYEPSIDPKDKNKGIVRVYKQGDGNDNQALAIRNMLLTLVNTTYNTLNEEGLVRNSKNLVYTALSSKALQDKIKESGMSTAEYWEKNQPDIVADTLYSMGLLDTVIADANRLGEQIFQLDLDIKAYENKSAEASNIKTDLAKVKDALKNDEYYNFLTERRDSLKKQYTSIINGDNADSYIGYAHMMLEDSPIMYYMNLLGNTEDNGKSKAITTIDNYAKEKFNIDYSSLDPNSQIKDYIDSSFKDFMTRNEQSFWKVWDFHKTLSETHAKEIMDMDNFLKDFKIDPFHEFITIGEYTSNLKKEVDDIYKKLDEQVANDSEFTSSPEYLASTLIAQQITDKINLYDKFNPTLHLNEFFNWDSFTKTFDKDFNLYGENQEYFTNGELLQNAKLQVQNYYNYLKDNKILMPSKEVASDYLIEFLKRVPLKANSNFVEILGNAAVTADLDILFPDGQLDEIDDPEGFVSDEFNAAAGFLVDKDNRNKFIDEVDGFISLLKINPFQGLVKYQELVDKINNELNFEVLNKYFNATPNVNKTYTAESLLNEIAFGQDEKFIDFIKDVTKSISDMPVTPTLEFLNNLSVKLTGGNNKIIDLLLQQRDALSAGIDSYQLNSTMKAALEDAQILLNLYTALIDSAQSNLNTQVNRFRENKEKLAEISEHTKQFLLKDIQYVQSQINYLQTLGGANLEKRLIEQQQIMKLDTIKRIKFFVNPPDFGKKLVDDLAKLFGNEDYFKTLAEEIFSEVDLNNISSEEDFSKFDIARVKFEDALYDKFNTLSEADKTIFIKNLTKVFTDNDEDFINTNAGVLSSELENTVTSYGMYRYFLLNLLTKSSNVLSEYKTVMKDSKFVPFYSQELIIRDVLSFIYNSNLYNIGVDALENLAKGNEDPFIKESSAIKNFLFVNGVPGAGKTAVIANTIKKIIRLHDNDDTKTAFISVSIKPEQANKLANSIEEADSAITFDVLENNISENKGTISYNDHTSHQELKDFKPKTDISVLTDKEAKRVVIFFDEIPLVSEGRFSRLSRFIDKLKENGHDVVLVGLGDLNQISAFENNTEISLTNTLFNSSFRLVSSFRETNQGKAENTAKIFNRIAQVQEEFYKNRAFPLAASRSEESADSKTTNLFSDKIELTWYDNGQAYYGDKFITSEQVKDTIEKLKRYVKKHDESSKVPEIAIVVDTDEDKANYLNYRNDSRIGIYNKTEVQGGEFDYVISDVPLNSAHSFLAAKEFYTLMSRARNATFFTEKSKLLGVFSSDKPTISAGNLLSSEDDNVQNQIYNTYREWRMKLANAIETSKPNEQPDVPELKTPISKPAEKPTYVAPEEQPVIDQEELIKNSIADELVSRGTNTKDTEALKERQSRSNGNDDLISRKQDDADAEIFVNWLNSFDPTTLSRSLVERTNNITEEEIEEYKDFIAYASSAILNKIDVRAALGELPNNKLNILKDVIAESIENNSGNYYATPFNDGKSLIYYLFSYNGKSYALPITIVNGDYEGLYGTLSVTKSVNEAFVSSKGEQFTDPSKIGKRKISIASKLSIFLGNPSSNLSVKDHLRSFRKGRTYAIYGPLNRSFEINGNQEIKDFLHPDVIENVIQDYYDINSPLRIRGIQNKVSLNKLFEISNWLWTANFDDDADRVKEAIGKIESYFGLHDYKPYYRTIKIEGEDLPIEEDEKKTSLKLLVGDPRRKFIDIYNKALGNTSINNSPITTFIAKGTPIFQINFYTDNNKTTIDQTVYLKYDKEWKRLVWIDHQTGNPRVGTSINDDNSFELSFGIDDTTSYVYSEIINKLVNLGDFKSTIFMNKDKDSEYFDDTYNKGLVTIDYMRGGIGENNEFYIYDYNIESLLNIFGQYPELQEVFAKELNNSKEFRHGIYLNVAADEYLNSEPGTDDAFWALTSPQDSWSLATDDCFVFAPIYEVELTDNKQGLLNDLRINRAPLNNDIIQSVSNEYVVDSEGNIKFNDAKVSRDWLEKYLTEDSKKKLNNKSFYRLVSIGPDKTIKLYLDQNDESNITTLQLNESFNPETEIFNRFVKHENTIIGINANADFVLSNKGLLVKLRSGETFDAEIVGINDTGYFYKYGNEIAFYENKSVNSQLLAPYITDTIRNRGVALANTDNGLIFVKPTNSGDNFTIFKDGVTSNIVYDSNTRTITLFDGKIINFPENSNFFINFASYKNSNSERISKLKNIILNKLEQLNLFSTEELNNLIDINESFLATLDYINNELEKRKYLSKNAYKYSVTEDGSIISKFDPTILIGNILLNEWKLNVSDIKSLEIIGNDKPEQNLYRFKVTTDSEYDTFYIEKTNNGWVLKQSTINPEQVDNRVNEVLNEIQQHYDETDLNAVTSFKEWFNAIKNGIDISSELNNTIDNYLEQFEQFDIELVDRILELQSTLKEECQI